MNQNLWADDMMFSLVRESDGKSFTILLEQIIGFWKKGNSSLLDRILRDVFTLPWPIEKLNSFVEILCAEEYDDEQSKKMVTMFRDITKEMFSLPEVLTKFGKWCQPEVELYNIRIRLEKYKVDENYIRKMGEKSRDYEEWLNADSKIPSRFNFTQTFEKEEPIFSSITGEVQSGKTSIAIKLAHKSILQGIPAIYVILARKTGHQQIDERLNMYNKDFREWCLTNQCEYSPMEYVFASNATVGIRERIKRFLNFKSRSPGLVIVYGNVSQIERVLSVQAEINGRTPYNLIVDEVDDQEKDRSAAMYLPYDELVNRADNIIGISATSFKYWYANKLVENINCYVLERHPFYRGIESIKLEYPVDEKTFMVNGTEPFYITDHGFQTYIKSLEEHEVFKYNDLITGEKTSQPVICLYRVSDVNKYHIEVFDYMRKFHRMKWCVIQFDGIDGANIKLYHSDFTDPSDEIKLHGKTYRPTASGTYLIKHSSISSVLGYLRRKMLEKNSFKNILIVTGKLACRQISYVCDEYKWHLSHMRILRAKTGGDCTDMIQQMRLCGIYKSDNIPLSLSVKATEFDDLNKAYKLQQNMIKQAQELKDPTAMFDLIFKASQSTISFGKSHVPKLKLQKLIPKRALKTHNDTIDIDQGDRGMEQKEQNLEHDDFEIRTIGPDVNLTRGQKKLYEQIEAVMDGIWICSRARLVNDICSRFGLKHQSVAGFISDMHDNIAKKGGNMEDCGLVFFRKRGEILWTVRLN